MNEKINNIVRTLGLNAHPEGGFYKETYRSGHLISKDNLPAGFSGPRALSTAIYFLLRSQDRSLFHKILSDEIWHFHTGSPLHIYLLKESGVDLLKLGPDFSAGQQLQHIIPAGTWFGALVAEPDSFTLCSCTVSPGFDFADFELAERKKLLSIYPEAAEIIGTLTKE